MSGFFIYVGKNMQSNKKDKMHKDILEKHIKNVYSVNVKINTMKYDGKKE